MMSMRMVSQTRDNVICFIETCSMKEVKDCVVSAWSKVQDHVTPPSAEVDENGLRIGPDAKTIAAPESKLE